VAAPASPHAAEQPAADALADAKAAGEGFSRFVAKVLDQLSLSAWLPATVLVGLTALLFELHSQVHINPGAAIAALAAKPLGIAIVLIVAIVVGTVITQAFPVYCHPSIGGLLAVLDVALRNCGKRRVLSVLAQDAHRPYNTSAEAESVQGRA
jgi:hypothetical protein